MNEWVCYLIRSLNSNRTYIGSSNNFMKRLNNHNLGKGAKYTRGETWVPILVISNFENKKSCLSFEAGWKKLSLKRNRKRLAIINLISKYYLFYSRDSQMNRIIDLLYFVHHFTYFGDKFRINYDMKHPSFLPERLLINIYMESWIERLPWPYFITTKKN